MKNRIKVFSGTSGLGLAKATCSFLSIPLGKARVARFSDGEVDVQLLEDVRGADVFIINSLHAPAENIIEMVLLSEAARTSSADRITIVPAYMGYNRQDRRDKPRTPISARLVMNFLASSCADRALLLDLHSEPTAGFLHPVVCDHLYASFVSIPYLKNILTNQFVVASPDKGGGPRAEAYARHLGQDDFVIFSKSRSKAGEIRAGSIRIIGDVHGKDVLFIDDMIDTGGTICADAIAAKEAGAGRIFVFATHAVFSQRALENLNKSPVDQIIVTDTISHAPEALQERCPKIHVVSVAPLMANAIRRIHDGESLSGLFI